MLLQDSNNVLWLLGVNDIGELTTTVSSGTPGFLFLNDAINKTWQIGVNTLGKLTRTPVLFQNSPLIFALISPGLIIWNLSILTSGLLQTTLFVVPIWQPNGFAAGNDNSVAGGHGGFLALGQPPLPSGVFSRSPEKNGQYQPFTATFAAAFMNSFVIRNPGRSA